MVVGLSKMVISYVKIDTEIGSGETPGITLPNRPPQHKRVDPHLLVIMFFRAPRGCYPLSSDPSPSPWDPHLQISEKIVALLNRIIFFTSTEPGNVTIS